MAKYFTFLILSLHFLVGAAQSIDHWETAVYNDEQWRYRVGTNEPPSDWMQPGFNDTQWFIGTGGFGYGDNDDNSQIATTLSVYLRKDFDIIDTAAIALAILHADYDDAFVAYLNGVEFARSNIGEAGIPPPFNTTASGLHEAVLYNGGTPENYMLLGSALKELLQEGSNTLAIQVHNENISSSDLSSNFFFSLGVEDQSMNYGQTPSWFAPPLLSSNLPLLLINTTETAEIFDEPKVPADFKIVDNGPGQINSILGAYNGYDGRIMIETRGASSQGFPKKNYGFETQLENGDNNNVSLLGMPEENDWILHGPFADKSLLRNVLAYHMGEATGRYAPRTRLCELIINGDYRGVYILTERIKRDANRVDIAKLTTVDVSGDELTGGYILQIDRDDDSTEDDGWYSFFPDYKFYAFNEPDYDEILPVQRNYIRDFISDFEQAMNGADYAETYVDYVEVESWIDYFLVSEIGKHIDGFKLSFYMHKKKDSNGGELNFGPLWDFNLGFGNFDFDCSPDPQGWSYEFRNTCGAPQPFWVKKLAEIPEVSNRTRCRWEELRAGPFRTDSLLQFIDDKVAFIGEARVRNFDRWPILGTYVWPNDFIGDTYEEEIVFLKFWLTQRLLWMDNNMLGDDCDLVSAETTISPSIKNLNIYPNPTSDYLWVAFESEKKENIQVALVDLLGHPVQTFRVENSGSKIDLRDIPAGMYLYSVLQNGQKISVGKLVKR